MSSGAAPVYTAQHEYARVDGSVAVVGISTYAQAQLGEVVFVQLPKVGDSFTKGQSFAVVESVKATSDVYAPVSGRVTAVNERVSSNPALVNDSPEGEAWLVRLEMTDAAEAAGLMDAAAYAKHCETASKHH